MGERAFSIAGLLTPALARLPSWTSEAARALQGGMRLVQEGGDWMQRRGRRVWEGEQRLHIAVRVGSAANARRLAKRLPAALESMDEVAWARVHPLLQHAIIQLAPEAPPAHARAHLIRRLTAVIDRVEGELGLATTSFATRDKPEHHPGDGLPLLLTAFETAVDLASGAAGLGLRRLGVSPPAIVFELMAALGPVADIPALRKGLERHFSIPGTEVWLELTEAALRPLLRADLGALTGVAHRALQLGELAARRDAWQQWETTLCAEPATVEAARYGPVHRRPLPLPEGPLEQSASRFALGTLSAFAAIWLSSQRLEPATAAVFAGLPRPARMGRDAFAARLGYRLARAGVLVRDPQVLRRLDRMDCVAVDSALNRTHPTEMKTLAQAVRQARLRLVWIGPTAASAAHDCPARHLQGKAVQAIRRLQREGAGVIYFSAYDGHGLARADCGIAFPVGSTPAPLSAHILIPGASAFLPALISAVAAAHRASRESVGLSSAKIALAAGLASSGLDRDATRRILSASGLTSLLAILDGVRLADRVALPTPRPATATVARHAWHSLPVDAVLSALDSSLWGLDEDVARQRRQPESHRHSAAAAFARLLGEEMQGPLTPVLAFGSALAWLSGARVDAALIAAVMSVNAFVGSAQRWRADTLISRLAQQEEPWVRVRRPGDSAQPVPQSDLVPGDVIELAAGDQVPADCRVVEAADLEVDEAGITGESLPVSKGPAPSAADTIAERTSMLYAGTYVVSGEACAVVTAVGADTEAGQAEQLASAHGARRSGVEQRLRLLTARTVPAAIGAGAILAVAGRLRGRPLAELLNTAVSLTVAAVPEGLPVLTQLAESSVAARLSRRGTIVRDTRAVEALGRMDVLCADKTGTLTEGQLSLRRISDGREAVSLEALTARHRQVLSVALRASPSRSRGAPTPHPTDRALIRAAESVGIASHEVSSQWVRLDELPFEPGRAYQAGLARLDGEMLISVKGAPEVLLPRCTHRLAGSRRRTLTSAEREALLTHAQDSAARGFRVLAVAQRRAHERRPVDGGRIRDLAFVGLLAFADPPRPSAREAISRLQRSGVAVVMVTGDHPRTATAIAAELGIAHDGIMTGSEIDKMSDERLTAAAAAVRVFARVTPAHKVRIVKALQRGGHVVGMTGDGANDAQAIRLADVGIALGQQSTAAARAAADLVVTDGRIETILAAVVEGRTLWRSLRDAISLLVGGNLGEILFTLAAALPSGRSPLNPRQLLLLNLVSDTVPALALALRQPRDGAHAEVAPALDFQLGQALKSDIARRAGVTAAATTLAWLGARLTRRNAAEDTGTTALLALNGVQLGQALIAGRGDRGVTASTLASLAGLVATLQNPGTSRLFGSRPQRPLGLLQATAAALLGSVAESALGSARPPIGERRKHARSGPSRSIEMTDRRTPEQRNGTTADKRGRPTGEELAALRQDLLHNPRAVTDLIRFTPVYEGEEISGYRVRPGPSPEIFYRLDLLPGDVVTHVNETPLTPPYYATLLRVATDSSAIRITLLRNGRPMNLRYRL